MHPMYPSFLHWPTVVTRNERTHLGSLPPYIWACPLRRNSGEIEARGGACDEIFDPQTPGLQHHQYHRSALKKHVGVMRFLSSGAAKSIHSFLMVVFLKVAYYGVNMGYLAGVNSPVLSRLYELYCLQWWRRRL